MDVDHETEQVLQQYAGKVAMVPHPQPYCDADTGAVCTCGRVVGLEAPRLRGGGSIPHADDCPVRIARAARRPAVSVSQYGMMPDGTRPDIARVEPAEAQAAMAAYLRERGLSVQHVCDGPERVTEPTVTVDAVTVTGEGVEFCVHCTVVWDRGTGRDESGHRYEDPVDEWEDTQVDIRSMRYAVDGDVPQGLMDIAWSRHHGGNVLMTLGLLLRGKLT